jgi:hypothetical protein
VKCVGQRSSPDALANGPPRTEEGHQELCGELTGQLKNISSKFAYGQLGIQKAQICADSIHPNRAANCSPNEFHKAFLTFSTRCVDDILRHLDRSESLVWPLANGATSHNAILTITESRSRNIIRAFVTGQKFLIQNETLRIFSLPHILSHKKPTLTSAALFLTSDSRDASCWLFGDPRQSENSYESMIHRKVAGSPILPTLNGA